MRHRYAAQHHLVAFPEAVHVEAEAAADFRTHRPAAARRGRDRLPSSL